MPGVAVCFSTGAFWWSLACLYAGFSVPLCQCSPTRSSRTPRVHIFAPSWLTTHLYKVFAVLDWLGAGRERRCALSWGAWGLGWDTLTWAFGTMEKSICSQHSCRVDVKEFSWSSDRPSFHFMALSGFQAELNRTEREHTRQVLLFGIFPWFRAREKCGFFHWPLVQF